MCRVLLMFKTEKFPLYLIEFFKINYQSCSYCYASYCHCLFVQTVKLSFDFPFYGHTIKNVTIATGGFLYTGDYIHSWLAATQYIAPLMANFDTRLFNESVIRYADNGTAFTVEWDKVSLQDRPNGGQFSFQVTLLKNGDIVFVYSNIPVLIDNIKEHHHPVKVGLSDAYIMDQKIFCKYRFESSLNII